MEVNREAERGSVVTDGGDKETALLALERAARVALAAGLSPGSIVEVVEVAVEGAE